MNVENIENPPVVIRPQRHLRAREVPSIQVLLNCLILDCTVLSVQNVGNLPSFVVVDDLVYGRDELVKGCACDLRHELLNFSGRRACLVLDHVLDDEFAFWLLEALFHSYLIVLAAEGVIRDKI